MSGDLGVLADRIRKGEDHLFWMECWACAREDGTPLKAHKPNKDDAIVAYWRGRLVGLKTVLDEATIAGVVSADESTIAEALRPRVDAYKSEAAPSDVVSVRYAKGFRDGVRCGLSHLERR